MTLLMRISLVLMLSTTTLGVFASQADEDKATIEEIIIAIENSTLLIIVIYFISN